MELARSVLQGDRLALARLLSHVENDTPEGRRALDWLFPHTGKAHLIGVTGAPGTGKSSLVNQAGAAHPQAGAARGNRGGRPLQPLHRRPCWATACACATWQATRACSSARWLRAARWAGWQPPRLPSRRVFDAAGFGSSSSKRVGAGQSEVDIARLAHTTLVVEAAGLGDDIQAIKAGILEIADILVINKADRSGVETTERALKTMLELAHPVRKVFRHHGQWMELNSEAAPQDGLWIPPVLRTVATTGSGLPELLEAIARHAAHLRSNGDWARRERARLQAEFDLRLQETLVERFLARIPSARLEGRSQRFKTAASPARSGLIPAQRNSVKGCQHGSS